MTGYSGKWSPTVTQARNAARRARLQAIARRDPDREAPEVEQRALTQDDLDAAELLAMSEREYEARIGRER